MYKPIKLLVFLIISLFIFNLNSTVLASNRQDDDIAYLQQALQTTSSAENLAYKINLSITSPLADGTINIDGKYSQILNTSGKMSFLFNSWIDTIQFEALAQYYTETANNTLNQYFKLQTTPPTKELNPEQWYFETVILADNVDDIYNTQKALNIDKITKHITNIFMYDSTNNTKKIYVTYKKPFFDEQSWEQALALYAKDEIKSKQLDRFSELLQTNPNLKTSLSTPRKFTYVFTVDKNTGYITNLTTDFSDSIHELGTEILDNIPDEEISKTSASVIRNTLKNYLKLSTFKLDITLTDINATKIDTLSAEEKTSAIAFPQNKL